jgi:hypothetical protein
MTTPPLYRFSSLQLSKLLLTNNYKELSSSEANGLLGSAENACHLENKNVHYQTHKRSPMVLVLNQTNTVFL